LLEHWDRTIRNRKKPLFILSDRLTVKMFAGARERVGSDSIEIEVNLPLSVLQLKQELAVQFETLRSLVEFGRIAIENEFVSDSTIIDQAHNHSVIALIPPVSGG